MTGHKKPGTICRFTLLVMLLLLFLAIVSLERREDEPPSLIKKTASSQPSLERFVETLKPAFTTEITSIAQPRPELLDSRLASEPPGVIWPKTESIDDELVRDEVDRIEKRLAETFEQDWSLPRSYTCVSDLACDSLVYYRYISPKARQYANQLLYRPTENPDYYNNTNIAYPTDIEVKTIVNGPFKVWYVTTGSQSVSYEYANKVATLIPQIHAKLVDNMGYNSPPGDGTKGGELNVYDIYITNLPSGIAGFCSASGVIGTPWASYIVLDNSLSYNDTRTSTSLSTTVAHEYFHSCQYAYDPTERTWWKETTAVWAQDEVFDDVNDYTLLLSPRFSTPHLPLDSSDGRIEYATSLFAKYLSESTGDTTIIRKIWELQGANRAESVPENTMPAVEEVISLYGKSVGTALGDFGAWLFKKDLYEEGALYPNLTVSGTVSAYPANITASSLSSGSLSHLSFHVLHFKPDTSGAQILSLTFDGDDHFPFAVTVFASGKGSLPNAIQRMSLNTSQSGNFEVSGMGTLYSAVAVVIVNTSFYSGGANYALSASTEPPAIMTLDKTELIFEASENTSPASKSVTLGNAGRGDLNWTASSSASWLSISPTSGMIDPGNVDMLGVSVNVASLGAAYSPYNAKITFSSNNAENSPLDLSVTLKLIYGTPYLSISPNTVQVAIAQSLNVLSVARITVENSGQGNMWWRVTPSANWLYMSISSGKLSARETVMTDVQLIGSLLPVSASTYNAKLIFSSDESLNNPVEVTLSVRVYPPDALVSDPQATGYTIMSTPYIWEPINSSEFDIMKYYSYRDDDVVGFYVPFSLTFFDRTYTTSDVFYISTNGLISFSAFGASSASNVVIPSATVPNAFIAPFWSDFEIPEDAGLYAKIFEVDDSSHYFIVEYNNVLSKSSGLRYTFQVLVNANGDIALRYASDMRTIQTGSIGIEDTTGQKGIKLAFNNPDEFPDAGVSILLSSKRDWPLLSVFPKVIFASVPQGQNFSTSFRITNSGAGTLSWRINPTEGLTFTPSSGAGEADISISGSSVGLATGTHVFSVIASAENGYEWGAESRFVLNVHSGQTISVTKQLLPGWNAVPIPLATRSSLHVGDVFNLAKNSTGILIASEIKLLDGFSAVSYKIGEGSTVSLLPGTGFLMYCTEAGTITLQGDPITQDIAYLSTGMNIICVSNLPTGELKAIWGFLDHYSVSFISPWEDSWLRSFNVETGQGVNIQGDTPLLISCRKPAFILIKP